MPSNGKAGGTGRSLRTTRLEAFSDGVFAIAITLLVLEIALRPPGSALEQVFRAWPAYLAYVVSFLTIGAAWLEHSALTDRLAHADPMLLRLNLLLLLVVGFLPFPTRLVSEALHSLDELRHERVFVMLFGLTLLAINLLGGALEEYARREKLFVAEGEGDELARYRRHSLTTAGAYVIAILTGLALPLLAVTFYFGIAVYLVVPFREVGRLLFRRGREVDEAPR